LVIRSKLIISKKEWVGKTGAGGEIKENEIVSRGYVTLKRKTTKITLKFIKGELVTKKEDCLTIWKRKIIDWEKDKVGEVTVSQEAKRIDLKEKIKTKIRP